VSVLSEQDRASVDDRAAASLSIESLTVSFPEGGRRRNVVEGVSLEATPGRTIALVGESGCGKSVTALASLRLLPTPPARVEGGRAIFRRDDTPIDALRAGASDLRRLRGGVAAMIFQEPMSSLNPVMTIGDQLIEAARLHRGARGRAARDLAAEALEEVGIREPRARLHAHPHHFSGGMRQRVMIAMALLCRPRVLIADEPTTALDVTVQAQILDLIDRAREERRMSVVLISHDLGVVADRADEVCVMYAGRIVERGPTRDVLTSPVHPYTRALLASIPRMRGPRDRLSTVSEIIADRTTFEGVKTRDAQARRAWWPDHEPPADVAPIDAPGGDSILVEIAPRRVVRVWRRVGDPD